MKTLQKFGLAATPEAFDAFEGISAAEMLTAARGLAAMSAHHGTNRDSWVRVSQALAAMAWQKELADMQSPITPPSGRKPTPQEFKALRDFVGPLLGIAIAHASRAGTGGGDACGAPARAGAVPLGNTGTTAVEGQ